MWTAADKQYFESLDDYEFIKPYLNLDDDSKEEIPVCANIFSCETQALMSNHSRLRSMYHLGN